MKCIFCDIAAGRIRAPVVHEDELTLTFLDHRPVFWGHTLTVPRQHVETLPELGLELLAPLMQVVQLMARAVPTAMGAQGSFVAMNNKVSQSVPHLHVHVVPRTRGDGLKGFFWPRHPYRDEQHVAEVAERIRSAIGVVG